MTDCPICLCPIASSTDGTDNNEPSWGVVTPCGHPYHRHCWDHYVANNGRRTRNNHHHPACAICNGNSTGFVPVFLDLGHHGNNDAGNNDSGGGNVSDGGVGGCNDDTDPLVDDSDQTISNNGGDNNTAEITDPLSVIDSLGDSNDDVVEQQLRVKRRRMFPYLEECMEKPFIDFSNKGSGWTRSLMNAMFPRQYQDLNDDKFGFRKIAQQYPWLIEKENGTIGIIQNAHGIVGERAFITTGMSKHKDINDFCEYVGCVCVGTVLGWY